MASALAYVTVPKVRPEKLHLRVGPSEKPQPNSQGCAHPEGGLLVTKVSHS